MVKFKSAQILIAVVLLGLSTDNALAAYTVDCTGYNNETSAYIYGECSDGYFSGYDSETGNYIYGDCSFGGDH